MLKRRWILIGLGLLAAVLALALGRSRGGLAVETALVVRDTLRIWVEEEGRTRVRERYVVAAPITGRLARIALREGEPVRTGDLLARLAPAPTDPRETRVARAQLAAAESRRGQVAAQLAQVRAQSEQAAREAARSRELAGAGALSREALERAELEAASARRQLAALQASLRAADADVRAARAALFGADTDGGVTTFREVRAPVAGLVLRVLETDERVVPAGTPLLELGSVAGLEVVVAVLSEDAARIRPGNPAVVEQWGGDEALPGRVRRVEPAAFTRVSALGVEEQRVNVLVDLLRVPPALGAGYRVEARILVWEAGGVLTAPTTALFQQDGRWQVFAVERGRAVLRTVTLGRRGAEAAEVVAGLREGEPVILFPSDLVEDGVRVAPRREYDPPP